MSECELEILNELTVGSTWKPIFCKKYRLGQDIQNPCGFEAELHNKSRFKS